MSLGPNWIRMSFLFILLLALALPAFADHSKSRRRAAFASLDGYQGVPAAVFTDGKGYFAAW